MPNVKPNSYHAIFLHRNDVDICDVEFNALSIGDMKYKFNNKFLSYEQKIPISAIVKKFAVFDPP